jgi:hypothetical protein
LNLTKYFYQIKINKKTFSFSCATSATEYPVFSFHFERMSHFGDRIKQQTGIFYLGRQYSTLFSFNKSSLF